MKPGAERGRERTSGWVIRLGEVLDGSTSSWLTPDVLWPQAASGAVASEIARPAGPAPLPPCPASEGAPAASPSSPGPAPSCTRPRTRLPGPPLQRPTPQADRNRERPAAGTNACRRPARASRLPTANHGPGAEHAHHGVQCWSRPRL